MRGDEDAYSLLIARCSLLRRRVQAMKTENWKLH